jgi:hypothetical protein
MIGEALIFGIHKGTVGRFFPVCDFQQIKNVTMEKSKGAYSTGRCQSGSGG